VAPEPEGSSPYSQQPTTGPYPEPTESTHYCLHKSLLLGPILSHINPDHILSPDFYVIHFNIILHFRLCLPSRLLYSGFLFIILCAFPVSSATHQRYRCEAMLRNGNWDSIERIAFKILYLVRNLFISWQPQLSVTGERERSILTEFWSEGYYALMFKHVNNWRVRPWAKFAANGTDILCATSWQRCTELHDIFWPLYNKLLLLYPPFIRNPSFSLHY
jgi:hypothetical protein